MRETNAAGRNTDNPRTPHPGGIEARLETQLDILTDGLRNALARAAEIPMDFDTVGHTRSSEFHNAIALAKASGELILALAKLNGRFNHDINVRRVAEGAPTPPPPPEN